MQKTAPPIADLPFLGTILAIHQHSREPSFWEVMSNGQFFQQLLACLNFTLDSEDLFCWYKQKKWFLNCDSSTSHWKPWSLVRIDLILTMRDIHINSNLNSFTKFTSSNRSTEFKDIFQWNISQIITKTVPLSKRIVISYVMKWPILLWIWWKVFGNWDKNMIRITQWRESHCRTNTSISRKKQIQKSKTVRATVWDPSRKLNHLSKPVWDRTVITEFTTSISSTRVS